MTHILSSEIRCSEELQRYAKVLKKCWHRLKIPWPQVRVLAGPLIQTVTLPLNYNDAVLWYTFGTPPHKNGYRKTLWQRLPRHPRRPGGRSFANAAGRPRSKRSVNNLFERIGIDIRSTQSCRGNIYAFNYFHDKCPQWISLVI